MESTPRKTISVHYIGTLDNGRIFSSTTEDAPLVFTAGGGEIFPKLEEAILAMKVGEVKNIVIPSADAFGPRLQGNMVRMPRAQLPASKPVSVGQKLSLQFGGNGERVMVVIAVDAEEVTLDGNHPLAGQDLTFALKVVGISRS